MPTDGIQYRTTDALKWGTGKGAPLTSLEGDDNMWELYSRLKALETNPPTAASISNIIVVGTQMSIQLSNGNTFGPYTLPIATFEFRGAYVPGTQYYELDLVSVPGQGLYLVRIAHVGENPFDPLAQDGLGNDLYLLVYGDDSGYIYDVGFFYPGLPGLGIEAGEPLAAHVLVRAARAPVGLTGSKAKLLTPPAAALSFPIQKNGVAIGSVDFASAATEGTFTFATQTDFAIDDQIMLMRPATLDPAARNISVTFTLTRI